MEFFLSRGGLGIGGHVVQEGAPCHLACAEGLGCGRGGWRNSEKGDKLSLRTWLASEGTVGVGQVRLLSLCTWTCVRLGGDTGVHGRKVQKGGASRGGMPHADPVTRPVARDPHLHISRGGGQRGGVEVCTLSHRGQGSKGETVYLSRIALAPLLGCQGRVARIPHVEDGEMPAHVSSRRHTRHTPACFATPVVHDHLHGNGHATGAVLPSIQPSCPPPSYPKRPCSCMHSTHGEWGRGRGKHQANGRGLRADTVSAPPPHRTSPFTCKGIGGMNSTCGREECPLSPRSIHDTERGGRENGLVRVRGRGEGRVQGTYQSRRHVFLTVLATRSRDVREGTARPGFCG